MSALLPRVLATSLFSLLLPFAAAAGPYVYLNAGAGWAEDATLTPSGFGAPVIAETKSGYNVGGAFGWEFGRFVRTEAELAFRSNDIERASGQPFRGETRSVAGMFNGYGQLPLGDVVKPYVGVGVGVARLWQQIELSSIDDHDAVFAYQVMGGVGFTVTEWLDLVLGYRFFSTTDADLTTGVTPFTLDYKTHTLEVGTRFNF